MITDVFARAKPDQGLMMKLSPSGVNPELYVGWFDTKGGSMIDHVFCYTKTPGVDNLKLLCVLCQLKPKPKPKGKPLTTGVDRNRCADCGELENLIPEFYKREARKCQ